MDTENKKNDH